MCVKTLLHPILIFYNVVVVVTLNVVRPPDNSGEVLICFTPELFCYARRSIGALTKISVVGSYKM